MASQGIAWRQVAAFSLAVVGCACCLGSFWAFRLDGLFDPMAALLAGFAVVTNLMAARWTSKLEISGSLLAALIAGAFLGPAAAFGVVLVSELVSWALERLRPIALPQNVFGLGAPTVAATAVLDAATPAGASQGLGFFLVFGLLSAAAVPVNFLLVTGIHILHDGGEGVWTRVRGQKGMLLLWALNVALVVAIAGVYAKAGTAAAAVLLIGLLVFTYQSRLVARAEERTREYASLSWGVLSGMLRNLDVRDHRTARHSAAVAMFARDIAKAVGLDDHECELAHTAGLLHDVGKFALSDRVLEPGVQLSETDWKGVRRHPDLGAGMLKDLGVYGPIAEIIRAHHERIDGRGYPAGLPAGEIPEIAKIVAVAEVYDTLTADDTYRNKMSSFEALNELRRVSGSQLEGRYVEALAEVLGGTGVEYRHAGGADFDRELDVERRINEAVAP